MGDGLPRHLVILSKAAQAIAEVRDIDEVKAIRDQGQAAMKWARSQRDIGLVARNDAAEIVLRAERRLGDLLAGMDLAKGSPGNQHTGQVDRSRDVTGPTLADHGISKMQSSRWQAEARVSEEEFLTWMGGIREADKELTSGELIKLGKQQPEPIGPYDGPRPSGIYKTMDEVIATGEKFACVYADPPWKYGNQATRSSTDNHYQTMTIDEIAAEPVPEVTAENCHLHLWTTNAFLFDAERVMNAWGFEYKSVLIWVKPQMGIGNYWRVSHEFLLFGIKGKQPFADRSHKSWFEANRTEHSRKPDEARKRIEDVSHGPYFEMYGRLGLKDWVVYGDQVERTWL